MIARIQKSLAEKDKGFTLIELLVVIIIIGILAAIAIPVFMNQRKKAVDSGVKSDLRSLATQIEDYWVDEQEYPEGATWVDTATIGSTTISLSQDNSFEYAPSGDGQSFTIIGTNSNGDKAAEAGGIVYDSSAGGLQDD